MWIVRVHSFYITLCHNLFWCQYIVDFMELNRYINFIIFFNIEINT